MQLPLIDRASSLTDAKLPNSIHGIVSVPPWRLESLLLNSWPLEISICDCQYINFAPNYFFISRLLIMTLLVNCSYLFCLQCLISMYKTSNLKVPPHSLPIVAQHQDKQMVLMFSFLFPKEERGELQEIDVTARVGTAIDILQAIASKVWFNSL